MAYRTLEFVLPDGSLHLLPWTGDGISRDHSLLNSPVNKGGPSPIRYQIFPSVTARESKALKYSDDLANYLGHRLIVRDVAMLWSGVLPMVDVRVRCPDLRKEYRLKTKPQDTISVLRHRVKCRDLQIAWLPFEVRGARLDDNVRI
jgi:hypothetical protein